MRKYMIVLWPLIAQVLIAAITLSKRPSPELELTVVESAGLSAFYTILVFFTALFMVYLIKRKSYRIIKGIIMLFFLYSSFISIDEILSAMVMAPWWIELLIAAIITILSLRRDLLGNIAKSFLSASLAFLFISFFNDLFIYFLLAALSLYDTYSVFRGPLSKILMVSESKDPLEPLMVFQGDVSMGLGDVFCYSMAAGVSLRSLGMPKGIIPIALLDLGIITTLWALYLKKRSLPGLTIPVLFWLAGNLTLLYL